MLGFSGEMVRTEDRAIRRRPFPAVVAADQARLGALVGEAADSLQTSTLFLHDQPGKELKPSDPAMAKRLDDLSEQIKELRQVVADALAAKAGSDKK